MVAVKTMRERMAVQLWPFRTVSWLFSICGVLALVLATVGLAGVVIHGVNRRLKEFGVRVSMGATPRDLVVDVLKSSVAMLLPGLIGGTVLAAGVARLARVAFIGVDVLNPMTYLAVALLECVVVIAACIGPALPGVAGGSTHRAALALTHLQFLHAIFEQLQRGFRTMPQINADKRRYADDRPITADHCRAPESRWAASAID